MDGNPSKGFSQKPQMNTGKYNST